MKNAAIFSLFTPVLLIACSAASGGDRSTEDSVAQVASPEVWSSEDDAAIFGTPLERKLAALPTAGEASTIPWAGNYWPTYEDNINHRWAGPSTDSPAKKYEKAFGGTNVEDAVSRNHGIDSQEDRHDDPRDNRSRRETAPTLYSAALRQRSRARSARPRERHTMTRTTMPPINPTR